MNKKTHQNKRKKAPTERALHEQTKKTETGEEGKKGIRDKKK